MLRGDFVAGCLHCSMAKVPPDGGRYTGEPAVARARLRAPDGFAAAVTFAADGAGLGGSSGSNLEIASLSAAEVAVVSGADAIAFRRDSLPSQRGRRRFSVR